jgi:membrane protease YdiL (CAAX protease family)
MSLDENNPIPAAMPEPAEAAAAPVARRAVFALPPDLRAPWGWVDLLILALLSLAASVAIGLLLTSVFAYFAIKPAQLRASPRELGLFTIVHQVLLILFLLGYLAAQLRLTFRSPFWRTIGWRPLEPGRVPRTVRYLGFVGGGFFLALFVQIASAAFGNNAKVPMETLFQDRRTALLLLLTAVFLAPVIEETIFRGYIYPVVARSFGVAAGVVGTGLLFGLLHAPQLWGGWAQITLLVFVGIVFTFARAATRSVLPSYILHFSYNLLTSLGFLLGSHWLRLIPRGH